MSLIDDLCQYDTRHPDYDPEFGEKEDGAFARPHCFCDNCFYGRAKLANEILAYYGKNEIISLQAQLDEANHKKDLPPNVGRNAGELQQFYWKCCRGKSLSAAINRRMRCMVMNPIQKGETKP